MNSLLQNMGSIWNDLSNIFYVVFDYLFNLAGTLDSITFTSDDLLVQWFGILHYILGDVVYFIFCSVFTIGTSFLLYKLFKKLFNFVISIIPGLNGGAI